ncbi:MAG: hypothetical protein JST10_00900 [Bacteroidetes bacterium]|nr:hypothetical protein [Bacteroidota bacterium]MBS1631108.1 hypothetical protein [Bacteroidota bacterium]
MSSNFMVKGKLVKRFCIAARSPMRYKIKNLRYSWPYEGYEGISFITFELFEEAATTKWDLTYKGLETFPKTTNKDFCQIKFCRRPDLSNRYIT